MPIKSSILRRVARFLVLSAGLKIVLFAAAYLLAVNAQEVRSGPSTIAIH